VAGGDLCTTTAAVERVERVLERQPRLHGTRGVLPASDFGPEAFETERSWTFDHRIILAAAEAVPSFPGVA
jgi:hypothetical protein